MRKLVVVLAVAAFATTAYGAAYSMNFVAGVGGPNLGDTITLAPSDIAFIEVWFLPDPTGFSTGNIALNVTGDPGAFTWDSIHPGGPTPPYYLYPTGFYGPGSDLNNGSFPLEYFPFNYGATPILFATLDIHCTGLDTVSVISAETVSPPLFAVDVHGTQYAGLTCNSLTVNRIPEPSSLALLVLGGLALIRRR
jgi:hypothetical protein